MRRGEFAARRREDSIKEKWREGGQHVRRREDSMEEKWRNRFSGNMEERINQKLDNPEKVSLVGSPVMTSTPRHMETLDRKTVNSRNRTHMLVRNNSTEADVSNVRMMVRNNVMEGENNVRNLVISHPGLEPVIRENSVETPTMYRRQAGTPLSGRRDQHRVLHSPRSDVGQRGQEIYGRIGNRFGNQVLNSPARWVESFSNIKVCN